MNEVAVSTDLTADEELCLCAFETAPGVHCRLCSLVFYSSFYCSFTAI